MSPAIGTTGFFEFEATIVKKGDNTNQDISASYRVNNGGVSSFNGALAINTATTNLDIVLDANLVVGDALNVRQWVITPENDIINYA